MRKVDQDFKELRTAYERNIQMVEKQKNMHEQYEGIFKKYHRVNTFCRT